MSRVTFIDTSVLCNLLSVPGKSQHVAEAKAELEVRSGRGERFILPVTTIIETGNHVEQATNNRSAAEAFARFVRSAIGGDGPFQANTLTWDTTFLERLLDGAATGVSLEDLASTHQLGSGDVAILVERDLYVAATAYQAADVEIWTRDGRLASYA